MPRGKKIIKYTFRCLGKYLLKDIQNLETKNYSIFLREILIDLKKCKNVSH